MMEEAFSLTDENRYAQKREYRKKNEKWAVPQGIDDDAAEQIAENRGKADRDG